LTKEVAQIGAAIVCANVRERPQHRSSVSASSRLPESRALYIAYVVTLRAANGLDRHHCQARRHSPVVSRHRSPRRADHRRRVRADCIYRDMLWWPATMAVVPKVRSPLRQDLVGGISATGSVTAWCTPRREPAYQRALDRAEGMLKRLGGAEWGSAFEGAPLPPKPPRMRWATYRLPEAAGWWASRAASVSWRDRLSRH
jgi:hypothetical protein